MSASDKEKVSNKDRREKEGKDARAGFLESLVAKLLKKQSLKEKRKRLKELKKEVEDGKIEDKKLVGVAVRNVAEELAREEIEVREKARRLVEELSKEEPDEEVLGEWKELVAQIGDEEELRKLVGEEVWQKFAEGKLGELGEKELGKLRKIDRKVGKEFGEESEEVEKTARWLSRKSEEEELDEARGLVDKLKEVVEMREVDDLTEEELETLEGLGVDGDGVIKIFVEEGGGTVLERVIADLDSLENPEDYADYVVKSLLAMEVELENARAKFILGDESGKKLADDKKTVKVGGVDLTLFGKTREERLRHLFGLVGKAGLGEEEVKRILKDGLELENDSQVEEMWARWQKWNASGEVRKMEKLIKRYEGDLRRKVGEMWEKKGRGKREKTVPVVNPYTGEKVEMDAEYWENLSEKEKEAYFKANPFLQTLEDLRWVGRGGGAEAYWRSAGVDREQIRMRRYDKDAERLAKEGLLEEEVLRLMRQIMKTGEPSRSEENRETVWRLYVYLGQLENAELRNEVVVKLLWYDVGLSLKGVGNMEDLARIGRWIWYEAYDDLLESGIDLGLLEIDGFEGRIKVTDLLAELESNPDGSYDIWLGRILGAKTPNKVELEKRRLGAVMVLKKMGYGYHFEDEGRRLVIDGDIDEELLQEVWAKFGLKNGGNGLVEMDKYGKRGDSDVFGESEFSWLIESSLAFESVTMRDIALEGGREWRLMINDKRKAHGYGQKFYMIKVDPRMAFWGDLYDLQWRSLPAWKFKEFLGVFEEKMEDKGMSSIQRKRFLKFLKGIALTEEVSPELVRVDKVRERLLDADNLIEIRTMLGESFDWAGVLRSMGVEIEGELSFEEGLARFAQEYHWSKFFSFASLGHSREADYWKYTLGSRKAFGLNIKAGDTLTPQLIAEITDSIKGEIGLGNEVAWAWSRLATHKLLETSGGPSLSYETYRDRSGKEKLVLWQWKDPETGEVWDDEVERAKKMGYEIGEDGYIYDAETGNRVFRPEKKGWSPLSQGSPFGAWGMKGMDFAYRQEMLDKWFRDGTITRGIWLSEKVWLKSLLWLGIKMERPPKNVGEFLGLAVKDLVIHPWKIPLMPITIIRGIYYDILLSDTADELSAAGKPLMDWFNQALGQTFGG